MKKVIEIDDLTKNYGKNRGVSHVSFSVEEGDILGFCGSNGAGKSTTIRSMLGFIRFESGSIRILGKDIKKNRNDILARTGYMPSEAMFYPSMKVKDVIKMAADIRKKDCREEAGRLCERLQIKTDGKIRELSLGNRKKVSIICAMQHRPELLILDEPTSGLDPLMQAEFFRLIQEYVKEGATCMLSTHILSEVREYCSHVAIMKEGKLQCVEETSHILKSNVKRIRVVCDGEEKNFIFEGDFNRLFQEWAGHDIADISIEELSPDEIFMHFYQK